MTLLVTGSTEVYSVEIRTYQFESGAYTSSCGECSRWFNVQADIAGSFTVAIDYSKKQGALLDLSAHITEAYELIGKLTDVGGVQQISFEKIPIPLESYGSELSFGRMIGDFGWEGFLSVDDGIVELMSSLSRGEEGDLPVLLFLPGYTVAMEQNKATLSISHQAIDLSFGVSILEAARVVPEPTTFALVALVIPFFIFHRRAAT